MMFGRKKVETAPIKEDVIESEEKATFTTITEPALSVEDDPFKALPDTKELVEEMFGDALDRFFVVDSKLVSGEKLAVIRLEDFYQIVCDRLHVDPESTQYSSYAS